MGSALLWKIDHGTFGRKLTALPNMNGMQRLWGFTGRACISLLFSSAASEHFWPMCSITNICIWCIPVTSDCPLIFFRHGRRCRRAGHVRGCMLSLVLISLLREGTAFSPSLGEYSRSGSSDSLWANPLCGRVVSERYVVSKQRTV